MIQLQIFSVILAKTVVSPCKLTRVKLVGQTMMLTSTLEAAEKKKEKKQQKNAALPLEMNFDTLTSFLA